jgi:teichuronic acid biosynthesis glycosyltransferase TuaG
MEELVSIITPCYNAEKFIAETIKSVQNQTYTNWEMIIIDDFSNDNSVQIIKNFTQYDARIQCIILPKNSGTGIARNTALDLVKGKYIAFLDADDLWKPQKIAIQVEYMKNNNLPFTFSFYECIDEEGKKKKILVKAPKELKYRQLFFCNYVGNLTGIYDTSFFGKIAISSIRKRQDWMVWLTVLKRIKVGYPITESLAYYRVRENSISASKVNLLQHNYQVYRQFHGYSILKSLFCMIGFLYTQLLIKPLFIKKI